MAKKSLLGKSVAGGSISIAIPKLSYVCVGQIKWVNILIWLRIRILPVGKGRYKYELRKGKVELCDSELELKVSYKIMISFKKCVCNHLKGLEATTVVVVSIFNAQILVSKYHFPLKWTRAPLLNSWFQVEYTRWAWNTLLYKEVRRCPNTNVDICKGHRN